MIKDEINEELDYHLSTFVINSHITNHPYQEVYDLNKRVLEEKSQQFDPLEADLLRGYIKYAREKCKPEITEKNRDMIQQFYVKLREESKSCGGMNIAVRHIESIIRLSVGTYQLFQPTQRFS